MPLRHIPGLALEHIPGNGTARFCHVCGKLYSWERPGQKDPGPHCSGNIRCHAVPERKPRQRKRRPGAPCCGTCWEDAPIEDIRAAVERAGKPALVPYKTGPGCWDIQHAASGSLIPAGLPSRKVAREVAAQIEALPQFAWRHPNPVSTNPQPIFDLIKAAKEKP